MEIGLLDLRSRFNVLGTGDGGEVYWPRLCPGVCNLDEKVYRKKETNLRYVLDPRQWSAFTFLSA